MSEETLFLKVDRRFLEMWLQEVSTIVESTNSFVDAASLSFICQIGSMACLQKCDLMPDDQESALDFSMNLVAKLWSVTPLGARERISEQHWRAFKRIDWREEDSLWHNLHVASAIHGFKRFFQDLYSGFPLLNENDRKELADLSPVIRIIERENTIELPYAQYFDYRFFHAFQRAQSEYHLASAPSDGSSMENALEHFGNDKALRKSINIMRAQPLIVAHHTQLPNPPNTSHKKVFQDLVSSSSFSKVWDEVTGRVKRDGNSLSRFQELALEVTFPCSYEAAGQLLNHKEFIAASLETITASQNTYALHTLLVSELYKLLFPALDEEHLERMLSNSPIFIYLTMKTIADMKRAASSVDESKLDESEKAFMGIRAYLDETLKKNLGRATEKIVADSNLTFYAEALADMESMGELFGVMAHELAHVVDELSDKAGEITEKIIAEYGIALLPEDYAKWGEAELFADLVALQFFATLFEKDEDVPNRNRLIQYYAYRRKLRKGLYTPFMKEPIIIIGSNLKVPIVVRRLAEEYEYTEQQKCRACGNSFERNLLERKSFVIYNGRLHDVLRCHCSTCKRKQEFYFDYTSTILISREERAGAVEEMKKIYGEITDPIPDDIFGHLGVARIQGTYAPQPSAFRDLTKNLEADKPQQSFWQRFRHLWRRLFFKDPSA